MNLTICEIKKPYYIEGKKYIRILNEEDDTVLIEDDFPFTKGTTLEGVAGEGFDSPKPQTEGMDRKEAVQLWSSYYQKKILTDVTPLNLNDEDMAKYTVYRKLRKFVSPKGALYFITTFEDMEMLKQKLSENPYWFHTYRHEIQEENFRKIDIQTEVSTFELRVEQIKACICYLLSNNENRGHTWTSFDGICYGVKRILVMDKHTEPDTKLITAVLNYASDIFYFDGERVAFLNTYRTEMEILENVNLLLAIHPLFREKIKLSEHLCEEQRTAVNGIVNDGNLSILTGKPGAGKTTCIADILNNYIQKPMKICLLAPTGKAVQRMRESLAENIPDIGEYDNVQMSTIHKFLGYGMPKFMQMEAIKSASEFGLCIIDESSMVDIFLFSELLQALKLTTCKIILVGDKNQLPSIHAGNILTDLIHIGVPTYYLEENHRSVKSIRHNGDIILAGDTSVPFEIDANFTFVPETELNHIFQSIDFTSPDVMFITPYRKPYTSTGQKITGNSTDINHMIHEKYFGDTRYSVGDKVICMKNNYTQAYFNGEVGFVYGIDESGLLVRLDDRVVTIKDRAEMDYAYATTVHKSQGSEYEEIYMYLPKDMSMSLLNKELLYTGVTRAKKKLTIIGEPETVYKAMETSANKRQTFLSIA
jgi:exodeoxyribonuclease V alpha subunit